MNTSLRASRLLSQSQLMTVYNLIKLTKMHSPNAEEEELDSVPHAEHLQVAQKLEEAEARIRALTDHNKELLRTLSGLEEHQVSHYLDRRRLRTLVENAPICVHEIGPDGNVQSMNPKGLAMLACTDASKVLGTSYLSSVAEEDYARIEQLMNDAFAGRGSDFVFVASDKESRRTFSSCFVPIFDELGNVERLMGCTREITEQLAVEAARQDLQKQVLHVQKLESLGLLAGGVAHDFNNMLTAIMGSIELAKLMTGTDHAAHAPLDSAQDAVELGANLCKQLLAYAGKGRFEVQPMNLRHAAEQVISMLQGSLPTNVTLAVSVEDATVSASAGQIDQVVLNLLMNATDALESAPGTITIKVSAQTLEDEQFTADVGGDVRAGTYAQLSVEDDGKGIESDALSRIFEPFFSTRDSGRGLGLSAVAGIVRAHKGYLRVESNPGHGTRFSVYLPTTEGKPVEPHPDKHHKSEGLCILVVDDDARVRHASARLLAACGYETLEATNGYEALDHVTENHQRIAAVLLDVSMPGLSGPQVFEKLRVISPTMPVVFCSGWERSEVNTSALERAVFLSKPYSLESLERALARVLTQDN